MIEKIETLTERLLLVHVTTAIHCARIASGKEIFQQIDVTDSLDEAIHLIDSCDLPDEPSEP